MSNYKKLLFSITLFTFSFCPSTVCMKIKTDHPVGKAVQNRIKSTEELIAYATLGAQTGALAGALISGSLTPQDEEISLKKIVICGAVGGLAGFLVRYFQKPKARKPHKVLPLVGKNWHRDLFSESA